MIENDSSSLEAIASINLQTIHLSLSELSVYYLVDLIRRTKKRIVIKSCLRLIDIHRSHIYFIYRMIQNHQTIGWVNCAWLLTSTHLNTNCHFFISSIWNYVLLVRYSLYGLISSCICILEYNRKNNHLSKKKWWTMTWWVFTSKILVLVDARTLICLYIYI